MWSEAISVDSIDCAQNNFPVDLFRKVDTFSMARSRRRYGETVHQEPSRFLLEIDPVLFITPVEGEPTPVQKTRQQDRARSDFFDNLKQFGSGT